MGSKSKGSFRQSCFFLVGALVYSLFLWITKSIIHVYAMILVGLACNILYKMDHKMSSQKEWIKTKDVIYMCVGVVFDSLCDGFPFNVLK